MNGPEHFRTAEDLLDTAAQHKGDAATLVRAQIHATLALAAAIVSTEEKIEWKEVMQ